MDKPNVFKSDQFYMNQGDVLHLLIQDESGDQISIELYGASTTPEATQWGDLKDYDGNIYTEVVIGTQRWIVENLRTTHYADGTLIPEVTLNANWILEDGTAGHDGAWCYYNNDVANLVDYGLLYNGFAATNSKNLAYFERDGVQELGWRVPTATDYEALSTYLGGRFVAGGKLKEIGLTHWNTPNAGVTNETGFSALGGGQRLSTGVFLEFNEKNALWTSPLADPGGTAYYCYLRYNGVDFTTPQYILATSCRSGMTVRCVKDETETYVFDYDGNQYQVITIGTQQWTLENLKTTHYGDGTAIPEITNGVAWLADVTGARCWYDNDEGYKNLYGALYNWYAVDNAHNLAYLTNSVGEEQVGWKVPTKADIETLNTYLGGYLTSGGKLKDSGFTNWNAPNTGATNESGFTALGGGERGDVGAFVNILQQGNLWASTEYDATDGDATIMIYSGEDNSYNNLPKFWGLSVRLVRNI